MTNKMASDNRKEPRVGLEIKIKLKLLQTNSNIYRWVQDLSTGGFKLKTEIPLEIKDTLQEGDKGKFQSYEDFLISKDKGGSDGLQSEIMW